MNLISSADCLLWAAQTHTHCMQNDAHVCVQICIIYMCAHAEGDGTLQDRRLRVADGLIPHIHLWYEGKEGKLFAADVGENPVGACTHSAGTLEGCHWRPWGWFWPPSSPTVLPCDRPCLWPGWQHCIPGEPHGPCLARRCGLYLDGQTVWLQIKSVYINSTCLNF